MLIYALMMRDFAFPTIADYHLANAKTGGGGTNVVNVILVDFRGYDTFGEIIVLGIAALVIFALTEALLRGGPANDRLLAWPQPERRAGDRHPMMLVVATRLILPVALMVGVFIFLRGHNLPGGGFIAGLIVAIALADAIHGLGLWLDGGAQTHRLSRADRLGRADCRGHRDRVMVYRAPLPDLGFRLCAPCRRWRSSSLPPLRSSIWACS